MVDNDALALVCASPAAVMAHDKPAWLALFARDHVLEDPVGGRPVVGGLYDRRSGGRGSGPLSRFWDTFIAPNDVTMEVRNEIIDGNVVARVAMIETRTPTGVVVHTAAHLVYELTREDGAMRIRRLAAHWEVGPVLRQLLGLAPERLRAMAQQTRRLIALQGIGGTMAFLRSVPSVGDAGKAALTELLAAAGRGDDGARRLLGGLVPTAPTALIASGDTVTALCEVDGAAAMLVCYLNRRDLRVVRSELHVDRR